MHSIAIVILIALFSVTHANFIPHKRYGETPWIPPCPGGNPIDGDGDCDNDHYGYWIRMRDVLITSVVILSVLLFLTVVWAIWKLIKYCRSTPKSLRSRNKGEYTYINK
jgi:hypothetical protein